MTGSPWTVEVMAGPAAGGGGEPTRLIPARVPAVFEISTAPGAATFSKNEVPAPCPVIYQRRVF